MNFAVAMRVEADNGKQTIYQDFFSGANKFEAMGKALEIFIRGGAILEVNTKLVSSKIDIDIKYGDAEILDLLHCGKKINAIKLRRERTGESLYEAKAYVESLQSKYNIPN